MVEVRDSEGEVVRITVLSVGYTAIETSNDVRYQCYRSVQHADATLSFGRSAPITTSISPPPHRNHPVPIHADVLIVWFSDYGDYWHTNGFGPFYCEAATACGDVTRVTTFFQRSDAKFIPSDGVFTKTVSVADTGVVISMTDRYQPDDDGSITWRKDGGDVLTQFEGQTSISFPSPIRISDQGIYEIYYDGERDQNRGGIYRLIVRECPAGKWGPPRCYGVCDNCYNGGVCDDKSGLCICPNNFKGKNCLEICRDDGGNNFGINCESYCSYRNSPTQCRGFLFCLPDPYGCSCDVGSQGLSCDSDCLVGTYGVGCSQTCHCADESSCDPFSGICTTGGCQPGWSGNNCQIPDICEAGYYGPQCIDKCYCMDDASCDKTTGACPQGKCALGYSVHEGNDTCQEDEPPLFEYCPMSVTVITDPGKATALVTWHEPSVSDNLPDPVTIVPVINRNDSEFSLYHSGSMFDTGNGMDFDIGMYIAKYNATDGSDQEVDTCSFEIHVKDTEDPVITDCPPSMTVPTEDGTMYATVSWNAPNATDNSNDVTLTFNEEHTWSNSGLFPIGLTPLSYTAEDPSGNRATCSFTISVIDNEEPVIRNCPPSMSVSMETGQDYATVSWVAPIVTDNSNRVTMTFNEADAWTNPDNFPEGMTSLSYTAEDAAGNKATCVFTISVLDKEEPVIHYCPPSMSVSMETGQDYGMVSWVAPIVTDNSNRVTMTFNEANAWTNPDNFPEGITSLSYTAEDAAGNTATCMFTIAVTDNEEPVIRNCPSSMSVSMETGRYYSTVSWIAPSVTDNSNRVTLIFNEADAWTNPDNFPEGITSLSYTAEDAAGNTATCMFTIAVIDNEEPVIRNCPPSMSVSMETGRDYAKVSWVAPIVTDNSNRVTMTFNEANAWTNPDNFPEGMTSLSYTAEDAAGNKATCMFTIAVIGRSIMLYQY
ncbi:hyalin-like [Lytechinus variegatus]|uniref:hyalin-like n=1 Tax=Lytechinus variegatus TaxID=7654 RepID=UPI001BB14F5F|nr:hyalin-like [Lytechinus variegatus]